MSPENGRLRTLSALCLSNYLDLRQCYLLLAPCHHLDSPSRYVHLSPVNHRRICTIGLIYIAAWYVLPRDNA